ncbi:MAG: hypothetical protein AB1450_10075 [Pseudomonadota bacterium]
MSPAPFHSTAQLREAFIGGLRPLLAQQSLGAFILVAANATFDAPVLTALGPALREQYAALRERFRAALAAGLPLNEVEEDLLVFLKIAAIGFDALQPTELRREGPWALQFNHLRSFRPKRISQQPPQGISAPFEERAFHFNKPFMQKEVFWRGELGGRSVDLYYNKYPFAELHTLLVPEREQCLPQYLQRSYHDYAWDVLAQLGTALPGAGIGYNSYGAFASVNHLHFQLYVGSAPLPVEDARWRHNGGAEIYPAPCMAFGDREAAWQAIADLHRGATPYSLLYRPGRLWLCPRRPQGQLAPPPWSSGFTWSEMAGAIVTFNREAYAGLTAEAIAACLAEAGT